MSCCFECRKQWEGKHRHENNIDLLITPGTAKNAEAFLYIYEKRCDKKQQHHEAQGLTFFFLFLFGLLLLSLLHTALQVFHDVQQLLRGL